MLLKNFMEEKQLDFNQPFLSVRRFSPAVPTAEPERKTKTDNASSRVPPLHPPVYRSELKSGPVSNPGTVPFVWEQTPGRPKNEGKRKGQALERPPAAPRLPPGRVLNAKQQAWDRSCEGTTDSQFQMTNLVSSSQNVPSFDKNLTAEEKSKNGMNETRSSSPEEDDDDEAYVDALDILSQSESFFLNCSISGISGLDGPELEPSGTFSTDPQTRDFMMGRFLPAAKAMASEPPQYSIRKQPVTREPPRQIKQVAFVEKRRPLDQNRLKNITHYAKSNGVEESEDDDDDYDAPENSAFKACGLFPQLRFQNSICCLNRVSGMRKHNQVPISLAHTRKVKSSFASSCSGIKNEHVRLAAYKQKSVNGFQKVGTREAKTKTNGECKIDNQKLDGSSQYNRLLSNGMLPCPNYFSEFPVNQGLLGFPGECQNSGVHGFNPHAKVGGNFRELLEKERDEWQSASASPVVEKTLYIDSVHTVKPQLCENAEMLVKSKEMGDTVSVDSSLQDVKNVNTVDEKAKVRKESFESMDSCFLSISDRSIHDIQIDKMVVSGQNQDHMRVSTTFMSPNADKGRNINSENQPGNLEMYHGPVTDFMELTGTKMADDGKTDLESHLQTRFSDQWTSNDDYPPRPLPPPLPKSPSESWLQRTLPSVKNPSLGSLLGMGIYPAVQASKTNSLDPKWETVVKTSNLEHGHLPFSEELLTTIPEV